MNNQFTFQQALDAASLHPEIPEFQWAVDRIRWLESQLANPQPSLAHYYSSLGSPKVPE